MQRKDATAKYIGSVKIPDGMDLSHSSGRALGKAITGIGERTADPMDVLK